MYDSQGNPGTGAGYSNLHYRLYYKDLVDFESRDGPNFDPCFEYDVYRSSSYNDLQTIDLGGVYGSTTLGVLFNDPSINNQWQQKGQDYALAGDLGLTAVRGYLTVDNAESGAGGISGEAFVFEFANGAAWGYEGMIGDNSFDFSSYGSDSPTNVMIMPFEEIATAFFVTPVPPDNSMAPPFLNEYEGYIQLAGSLMFDRDENLVSGGRPQDVVCTGRVDAGDLVTNAAAGALANGGWGELENYAVSGNSEAEGAAVVIKLEYGQDSFNGEPMNGVYNNAFVLPPRFVD